jgi:hypothetical protein
MKKKDSSTPSNPHDFLFLINIKYVYTDTVPIVRSSMDVLVDEWNALSRLSLSASLP